MKILLLALFIICLFPIQGWADSLEEEYKLKDMCEKKVKEFFKENYDKTVARYQSHYNKKLKMCFILVTETTIWGFYDEIFDVDGKKRYGQNLFTNNMRRCSVLEKYCESDKEFEKLIKPYMEK
ncbi:MAG: hypothetical protein HY036_01435 [Nitrospirae bacterium]|nr:hypothetical protein [Nitrospirota bacterium]MBI3351220.1 hypothetical protein [Nitrospirota bacterium]